jgi:cell division protein FtsI (penicillin-binding protein 3)
MSGSLMTAVASARADAPRLRRRAGLTLLALIFCFAAIAGQLVRLALRSGPELKAALAEPIARTTARPDIVDRHGRLIATDIAVNSLYADPQLILDLDEAVEKLTAALPGLDAADLRRALGDRSRRFVWVARALSPRLAQRVHDLGLPGLASAPS